MIPTIHLTHNPTKDEIQLLRHACENVGFFYLKVGTSEGQDELKQLQRQVLSQSKAFFALPLDIKKNISDSKLNRGYTGFEEETLDPMKQSKGDTKEGFYIADDISKDDSDRYNPDKLCGPNVWPDNIDSEEFHFDAVLFKDVMVAYHQRMKVIGFTVVQMLALSLNLPREYFDSCFDTNPMAFLRLLHYSSEQSNMEEGIYACGAHSDYGMITILATDENPGLQIKFDEDDDKNSNRNDEECWIDVAPPPLGTFVVNLGDMLERWTNGRYKSTVHRVLSKTGRERFSMPFFYEPAFDTIVTCLPSCIGEDGIVKYPPTTSGQHLISKYKETHADFEHK